MGKEEQKDEIKMGLLMATHISSHIYWPTDTHLPHLVGFSFSTST